MPPPRWDVIVSVLLTRRPIIGPPMTIVEDKFQRLSVQRENDGSLLCDFELKTKKDEALEKRRAILLEEGKDLSELEGELGQTNAMREDEWAKKEETLRKRMEYGETPSTDVSSLSRLLDRRLALVVKHRFGRKEYESPWILPQMKNLKGESLKETADRCMSSLLPGSNAFHFSNAPFAVHTQRYSKGLRERLKTDATGAKLFFYSADLPKKVDSFLMNKDEISSHSWLTQEEVFSTVKALKYKQTICRAMIE